MERAGRGGDGGRGGVSIGEWGGRVGGWKDCQEYNDL